MAKKASPRVRLVSAEGPSEPSRPDLEKKPQADLLPDKSADEIQQSVQDLTAEVKKFKITSYEEHLENAKKKAQGQNPEEIVSAPVPGIKPEDFDNPGEVVDDSKENTPPAAPVNVKRGEKISKVTPEASEGDIVQLKEEIKALEKELVKRQKLVDFDKDPRVTGGTPSTYADRNLKDLNDLKARKDELLSSIRSIETPDLSSPEKNKELADLDARIARYEKMILTDRSTPGLYVERNKADLAEFKARRKQLIEEAKNPKAPVEEAPPQESEPEFPILPRPERYDPDKPGPNRLFLAPESDTETVSSEVPEPIPAELSHETVVPPAVPETRPESRPMAAERARVDAKALHREMLQKSLDKINVELPIQQEKDLKVPGWYRLWDGRTKEMRDLLKEKERLEEELSPKVGFGNKFKETAKKAFSKTKKKFQELDDPYRQNKSSPIGLGLSEASIRQKADSRDIARVEEMAAGRGIEQRSGEKTWKGWFKERLKGVGTIGFWEFYQANKFEAGTDSTAKDTKHFTHLMQKEQGANGEGLSLEDALAESEKIGNTDGKSRDAIEKLSQEITDRKVRENDALIEDIILVGLDKLEERLKNYKGVSGQDVLTPENRDRIAEELRANLRNLRTGYGKDNEGSMKRIRDIMRMNLEEDWWKRYVYGEAEVVLAGLGAGWLAGHVFQTEVVQAVAAKGGAITLKEAGPIALKKHLTYMATMRMKAAGLTNFTEAQLHQVVMAMVKENGVKVLAWKGTAGSLLDTGMAKGMLIKVGAADKVIAALKVAGAAGGL